MSEDTHAKGIAIVGPTASGKSEIAIKLAQKYNGEIISCDSRQIYRGMDIGTGKVKNDLSEISNFQFPISKYKEVTIFISEKIRHHCIDIISPNTPYSVAQFQKKANTAIKDILRRGKLPILCGGTGLWAQAVVENMSFPKVLPNAELRNSLQNASAQKLFTQLQKLNPDRANTIDPKNKHRIIRAIELSLAQKASSPPLENDEGGEKSLPASDRQATQSLTKKSIHWTIIAIAPHKEILFKKIEQRLDDRLARGMIEEVNSLHRNKKVSWNRLDSFGLEYRWISRFLRGLVSQDEMREKLLIDIRHYAKRQLTWLHRWEKMGRTIHWVTSSKETELIIKTFLKK